MGEEMRKEKVTPRGTPPSIKPINKGTAEQEQKGVTTPRREAKILPINSFLWDSIFLVFSGGKKLRTKEIANIITARSMNILIES
jgi:hypothetical protein